MSPEERYRRELEGVKGTLRMFNEHPTLMPMAPDTAGTREMGIRAHKGGLRCFRCREQAVGCFIAVTKAGRRWIDACQRCADFVRIALAEIIHEEDVAGESD